MPNDEVSCKCTIIINPFFLVGYGVLFENYSQVVFTVYVFIAS